MSIILDALRKSESERLREAEAHRSELPRARGRTSMPWWVWAVALLLLANITLLLWLALRSAPATSDAFTSRAAGREVRDLERLAAAGTETTGSAAAANWSAISRTMFGRCVGTVCIKGFPILMPA